MADEKIKLEWDNIEELKGMVLLVEVKDKIFEGEVVDFRKGLVKISEHGLKGQWYKKEDVKVVDILK